MDLIVLNNPKRYTISSYTGPRITSVIPIITGDTLTNVLIVVSLSFGTVSLTKKPVINPYSIVVTRRMIPKVMPSLIFLVYLKSKIISFKYLIPTRGKIIANPIP